MSAIRSAFRELVGLFIDDSALALLLVALIAIACALEALGVSHAVLGALIVAGAVGALVTSVLRGARRT